MGNFVVDKVAMGQDVIRAFVFSPVNVSFDTFILLSPSLYNFMIRQLC